MANKQIIFIAVLIVTLAASAGVIWAFIFNQPEIKRNSPVPPDHVFGCYYSYGKSPARCYEVSDDVSASACLGYYDLIGNRMEDGIKVPIIKVLLVKH